MAKLNSKLNKLEYIREQLGWTKKELAKRLGVTERTIHQYYSTQNIPKQIIITVCLYYKLLKEK